LISVHDVKVTYDGIIALDGLSLSVADGEFVGLIGPNGCGKSTLVRVISGIVLPHRGRVELKSSPLEEMSRREIARTVAVVPQESYFFLDFRCLDIVLMGRNPYLPRFQSETEEDYHVALDAMKVTDTLHLRDRGVNEISGGEKQRVVIARALAQKPRILLLDEPTAHLDIDHEIEIFDLLKRLNREGLTILVVSHDINVAAEYCERILLMVKGRLAAEGSPEDVITHDILHGVYGARVLVGRNPRTGAPHVLLAPEHGRGEDEKDT
jgi:iron complex transport system ATP-binding protein